MKKLWVSVANKGIKVKTIGYFSSVSIIHFSEHGILKNDIIMKYTCPMHSEIIREKEDRCPICGMELVLQKSVHKSNSGHHGSENSDTTLKEYMPLFTIIGLILLVTITLSWRDIFVQTFTIRNAMQYFMAGFFLVFSGFKLVDLHGFAKGYSTYDLLAKRWFTYGYIYPFIELFLGLSYAVGYMPDSLNIFAFFLMMFSGIGVAIKIAKKEKFQCACLGTFLKVPLTEVTLIEDFGMAVMAILMIIL